MHEQQRFSGHFGVRIDSSNDKAPWRQVIRSQRPRYRSSKERSDNNEQIRSEIDAMPSWGRKNGCTERYEQCSADNNVLQWIGKRDSSYSCSIPLIRELALHQYDWYAPEIRWLLSIKIGAWHQYWRILHEEFCDRLRTKYKLEQQKRDKGNW